MIRAIVFLGGCILLLSQFQVTGGLYGGIDTSNYFALLLGTMVAMVWLLKVPRTLYWGDTVVFVLFVYCWCMRVRLMQCRVESFICVFLVSHFTRCFG